jgi:hypothetical protein
VHEEEFAQKYFDCRYLTGSGQGKASQHIIRICGLSDSIFKFIENQ